MNPSTQYILSTAEYIISEGWYASQTETVDSIKEFLLDDDNMEDCISNFNQDDVDWELVLKFITSHKNYLS